MRLSVDLSAEELERLEEHELEELKTKLAEAIGLLDQQISLRNYPGDASLLKPFVLDDLNFHAEACEAGFLINPLLPDGFTVTANDERSDQEKKLWWDRPYIITNDWASLEKSTRARQALFVAQGSEYAKPDIESAIALDREKWHQQYPSGVRFSVECLDGGAWDRPTWWGDADTLEKAIDICRNGPYRRR